MINLLRCRADARIVPKANTADGRLRLIPDCPWLTC
jgi:hypothetical protein